MPRTFTFQADFSSDTLPGVGYALIDPAGVVVIARTTAGVVNLGGGSYGAALTLPDAFSVGFLRWDDGQTPPEYKTLPVNAQALSAEAGVTAQASYPNASDLTAYITSLGIFMVAGGLDGLNLPAKISAAIAVWERLTLWTPFLANGETSRVFDPPSESRFLNLGGGLLSCTSLLTGLGPSGAGGSSQALGQSYRLLPVNAPVMGRPYEVVEFLLAGYGYGGGGYGFASGYGGGYGADGFLGAYRQAQSIKITGAWGRQKTITQDVWQAVLQQAALLCAPELAMMISRGLIGWTGEGGVGEKYGQDLLAGQSALWRAGFETAVQTYKREMIYL